MSDRHDMIEQAARLLFERLGSGGDWGTLPEWRKTAFRSAAHILADAGLLRTEPPPVLIVHHHDIEAHAASFNEGFAEAMSQRWPVLAWLRRWFR